MGSLGKELRGGTSVESQGRIYMLWKVNHRGGEELGCELFGFMLVCCLLSAQKLGKLCEDYAVRWRKDLN
jgi:hypothetical protein